MLASACLCYGACALTLKDETQEQAGLHRTRQNMEVSSRQSSPHQCTTHCCRNSQNHNFCNVTHFRSTPEAENKVVQILLRAPWYLRETVLGWLIHRIQATPNSGIPQPLPSPSLPPSPPQENVPGALDLHPGLTAFGCATHQDVTLALGTPRTGQPQEHRAHRATALANCTHTPCRTHILLCTFSLRDVSTSRTRMAQGVCSVYVTSLHLALSILMFHPPSLLFPHGHLDTWPIPRTYHKRHCRVR